MMKGEWREKCGLMVQLVLVTFNHNYLEDISVIKGKLELHQDEHTQHC